MFDKVPKQVFLCFSQKQDLYDTLYNEGVVDRLINGYPSYDEISKMIAPYKKEGSILVLDDGLTLPLRQTGPSCTQ